MPNPQWHFKRNLANMTPAGIEEKMKEGGHAESMAAKRRIAARVRETIHERVLDTPLGVQLEMFGEAP